MVLDLWPGNWQKQLHCLNVAITVWNDKPENRKKKEEEEEEKYSKKK
jgi:hypothetical protein